MLKQLNIQNLAIAENISVVFKNGLNVITGETGAGKSLLVDAMSLLRGSRVDTHLIRTGQESALITGIFIPNYNKSVIFNLLNELGIPLYTDDPEEIVIKRFIQRNGKHRSTVNDTLVSTKTLQYISAELIDISSQFENQRLLDTDTHTYYLDNLANNSERYKNYLQLYNHATEKIKIIKSLLNEQDLLKREKDLYEFELSQIHNAKISIEEFNKLEELILIGKKSKTAKNICDEIILNLCQGEINCLDILRVTRKNIDKLNKVSNLNSSESSQDKIDSIISLVEDLSHTIEITSSNYEVDTNTLQHALIRMETYNKILQKFGPKIEDVFNYKEKCESFLNKERSIEDEIQLELKKCEEIMIRTIELARVLSNNRNKKIPILAKSIEKELSDLGMPKAKFVCDLKENLKVNDLNDFTLMNTSLTIRETLSEFSFLTKLGFEKAQFLLSTNVGIETQPIDKVASGGELSRIMLAIKNIIFGDNSMSVFVFDEIDTGISGNIATKVGRKLLDFCRSSNGEFTRQAICITHLPQVASFAQSHFIVSKKLTNNKTITKISEANEKEKLTEIAILLSGEAVSQESIAQAKVLVYEAQKNLL